MRCPQLVGRDQELADLLAAATAGVGVVRLLVGEAGVGKTRLLEELAGELPSGAVLWGRASTTNRTPYRPVVEVVLAGLRRWGVPPAEAGSPYVRVFGRWIPELAAGAVTGEIETMVLAEATLRLMAGWPKPLVVVFEDLHWADEETLSTFQYLAHNAGETGALVAGTVRTGEPVSSSAVLGQVRTEVELTLRPLSAQEVERMAQLCRPDQSVMPDLARRSGGLPLVIENLLDANPADARLADVIAMRCTRMSSAAQRALAVASIAGLDVPVELLGEVLPEPLSAIRRALDEAVRAELLVRSGDAYQFRHDLIRRAVFESMPIEDRREMAAAMAVRRSERAEWSSAAELWELVGDTDAAASCYLEAAGEAANAGAFLTAKAGLTKTVDLVKTGPIWAEATWRLMTVNESLGMADEVARIGSSLAATLEVADPRRALEAQLRIARAFQAAGRWQEASRRLDLVRARAGSDPLLLGMTKLIEARHLMDEAKPGSYQQAWELASETVDLAARATRVDTQCEALEVAALCSRVVDLDESIELLRTMLSLAERHGLEYWRLRGLNELGTAEMLRWAIDDRLQEALRRARAVGAVSTVVAVLVNLAAFQAMTGRHDAVLATVNEVEHVMGRVGLSPLRAAAVRLRGLARGYRSGAAAMEAEFESAARITPPDGDALALEWGLGRGMVALMEEDPGF